MKRLPIILQVMITFLLLLTGVAVATEPSSVIPQDGAFELSEFEGGVTSLGLYERMSTLCEKNHGEVTYVIPKQVGRYKRLSEVGASEALDYVTSRLHGDNTWFMSCDGNLRFMVEKRLRAMNNGHDTAAFYMDRGLEGVNYLRMGDTPAYANTKLVQKTPEQKKAFREQMAWEVATMGTDFVKPEDTSRYIGFYKGNYEGGSCKSVAIKEMSKKETNRMIVYDFKVCNRRVASLGQRVIENHGTEFMYADFLARP